MIKARITQQDGSHYILFGLTRANINAMLNNRPMKIDGADLGVEKTTFIVMAAETEADIREDLRAIGVIRT